MNEILFLTPMSLDPMHVRVEMTKNILEKRGFKVYIYNLQCKTLFNKINYLSLSFFDIVAMLKSLKYMLKHHQVEVLYITDLKYLPIVIIGKIFRKKIVYETLDNNVELRYYDMSNRHNFLKRIKFIKYFIFKIEKFLTKNFVDSVIVNSKELVKYFKPIKTNLIFYSSPFENNYKINYSNDRLATLYLGLFSKDKGALEVLKFIEKFQIKSFIFGTVKEEELKKRIKLLKERNLIYYRKNISSNELKKELENIFKEYRLIGFSLIKPIHYSYATQEANKDIDYLAMGIPIIGNTRVPTKEKIDNGCGIFLHDYKNINRILLDKNYYKTISEKCINYYIQNYTQEIYKKKILKIMETVC